MLTVQCNWVGEELGDSFSRDAKKESEALFKGNGEENTVKMNIETKATELLC